MASPRIYLDYNATAPTRPAARDAFLQAAEAGGNASSVHAEGRRARNHIEAARRTLGSLVGARPEQVFFTSGGTEAANLALSPLRFTRGGTAGERLLVGATEHAAVLNGHRFAPDLVEVLPVGPDGTADLERLDSVLKRTGPAVVAVQAANNETGVLQPVREISDIVHGRDGILVCDAVQAAGRIPCGPEALGADVVLVSAHKLGGLPGAGAATVLRDDLVMGPLVRGGGQERGMRAGTENVPAIAAFGAALQEAMSEAGQPRLAVLRDRFEAELRRIAPDVTIFCADRARLPNTSAFAIPGVTAERLMMALDLAGVAVSSGSACSSGKVGRSHVLEAMGVSPDLRLGAIRVSLGWRSAGDDVDGVIEALTMALDRMKRRPLLSAA